MGSIDYKALYKLQDEELIIRLKSFPSSLLQEIKIIDDTFLDDFESDFSKIIDKIKTKEKNV